MALIVSNNKALSSFEIAMKRAWATGNGDGVGCYWREFPTPKSGNPMKLARFKHSMDLTHIGSTYDRMLIHFRNSTRGEGTHPFTCRHRPDLKSGEWFMVHNGVVQDDRARTALKARHTFSTNIDSESLVHLWGETEEKDLLKKAKKFYNKANELGVAGWANLIFYNVVTDEWVGICDNSLEVLYSKDVLVLCSDTMWVDMDEAKRRSIKHKDLKAGDVIYGRGTGFKIKAGLWNRTTLKPVTSCYTNQRQNTGYRYLYDADGDSYPSVPHQVSLNHPFISKGMSLKDEEGQVLCDICYETKIMHDLVKQAIANGDVSEDEDETETEHLDKWNRKHIFIRDLSANMVRCKCGSVSSFGVIHLPHAFVPIMDASQKTTTYCRCCGSTRVVGNHPEDGPTSHFFTPVKIEIVQNDTVSYKDSVFCARCNFKETDHTMTYLPTSSAKTVTISRLRPNIPSLLPCACNYTTKTICKFHWGEGYQLWDENGMLVKEESAKGKGVQ